MATTADLMPGDWGKPIDVPLPEGWEYESNENERNMVCPDDWSYWKNEDRTPILCESLAVRALMGKNWECIPFLGECGDVGWKCRPSYGVGQSGFVDLPDAVIAEFGGEG